MLNGIEFKKSDANALPYGLNRIIDEILDTNFKVTNWTPAVDFLETEKSYELQLMLPGFTKEAIRIELEENILRISGERKPSYPENAKMLLRESPNGKFSRSFSISKDVNPETVEAGFENGILYIKMQKSEKAINRIIEVK